VDQVFIFVLMLAAVVVANVLAKYLPKIPLPFWLIGLGMGLAIFPFFRNFTLDPSVFSFAIIAPLLFNEGRMPPDYGSAARWVIFSPWRWAWC
jgi:CPA1 family monovalent cation:H+ antiporter